MSWPVTGIPNRVGSYEDVAKDPGVDICYVGMLHPFHYENAVTALQNGKHVLVEKPSTCSECDTKALVRLVRASNISNQHSLPCPPVFFSPLLPLSCASSEQACLFSVFINPWNQAQEKGLFLMEGMWTRFFPAVEKAQELVKSGTIGKVVAVHSDFGFNGGDVANYPDHIFYNLNLGGGGLFYVAPYPVAAAMQFLGPVFPSRIAAAGVKDKLTGVDLSGAISLHFEGKGIASLTYNIEVRWPSFLVLKEAILLGLRTSSTRVLFPPFYLVPANFAAPSNTIM